MARIITLLAAAFLASCCPPPTAPRAKPHRHIENATGIYIGTKQCPETFDHLCFVVDGVTVGCACGFWMRD